MKKIILISALLWSTVSITNCSSKQKQIIQDPPPDPINVMWQDISNWDSTTASKVSHYNPDKFIINVDGPGSSGDNPKCGPHIKDIIPFIDTLVNVFGYKGILVMHPDCSKGDYGNDWMGKGNLPNIDSLGFEVYKVYVDYFKEMNDSLTKAGLPTFTELLLETESSYMCSSKSQFQKIFFDSVRYYVNEAIDEADKVRYDREIMVAYNKIANEVDALYLTPGSRDTTRLIDYMKPFYDQKIPVFSQVGPLEVSHGALLSVYRFNYDEVGFFGSDRLIRILKGTAAGSLTQKFGETPSVFLNLAVAEKIKYKIPLNILLISDRIFTNIESEEVK